MSNMESLRGFYEAVAKEDFAGIMEPLADDIQWDVWDPPGAEQATIPYMAPRRGKGEVPGFFEALQVADWHRFEPTDFCDGGDLIAVRVVVDATIKATGKRFQDDEIHLWTFGPHGKIVGFRHYADTSKHAAAQS